MKKWYIIILLAFCLSPVAFSQIDTAFWFTAPSLTATHTPTNIWLVIVTYGDGAEVSISQPARPRTLMTERRIEANSTFTFNVKAVNDYTNEIETKADQLAHDNGIYIRSSVPVSAYYVATDPNSEIYTLKGQHGLGIEFVVPTQNRRPCTHEKPAYNSIEMVATEDNTTITIETTQPTNELATAGTVTVTLNRGQSYAIRSREPNTPGVNHLGGTRIKSDKPIAVNTTEDSSGWPGSGRDLIGEQLVPVSLVGCNYIAVSNNSDNEYAYFYSLDNTPVEIYTKGADGTSDVLVGTTPTNGPLEVQLKKQSAQTFYSLTNTPFVLYQITADGLELSGTMLPALNCSGSDEVSYIPALNTVASNVTILTRTEFTDGFSVNGDAQRLSAASFLPVPGAPEWSYSPFITIQLEGSEKTLRIRNHKGVFHLGVMDGGGGAVSYGYFSNFGKISMSCSSLQNYYYEGQDIHLHLVAAETYDSIWWEGPKGIFGINDSTPVIPNATRADRGMYVVNGIPKEGCEIDPDTFYLTILEAVGEPRIENICYGDPVTIQSNGDAPYTWFKDDEPMPEQTSSTYTYTPTASSSFVISSTTPGEDVFSQGAIREYTYTEQKDTAIMWAETYKHCIPGEEYVFNVSLGVTGTNPVAPRLLLYVNGVYSEPRALPNNSTGQILSITFKPQDRYAVMRLVAVNTRPNRHFNLESLSLKPVLSKTELIDVNLLPKPTSEMPLAVLNYCDTLPAFVWRGKEIYTPGTYLDTTRSSYGCDSIYHTLIFDTIHCVPPCPIPLMSDTAATVCDTMPKFIWHGKTCMAPGEYYDTIRSRGCDSIYQKLTLSTVSCMPDPIAFTLDSTVEACDGDSSFYLPIHLTSGSPEWAVVSYINRKDTFSFSAGQQGVEVPLEAEPNYYSIKVVLSSSQYASRDSAVTHLTVFYDPQKVFAQKWNNVFAIYSPQASGYPEYTWTAYHWYRDNVDLQVSTSFYHIENGVFMPRDCYRVLLTRSKDLVTLFTCPYCISPETDLQNVSETTPTNIRKFIRQGQLIICVDGIEYNALGTRQ